MFYHLSVSIVLYMFSEELVSRIVWCTPPYILDFKPRLLVLSGEVPYLRKQTFVTTILSPLLGISLRYNTIKCFVALIFACIMLIFVVGVLVNNSSLGYGCPRLAIHIV
jgi:hypothetical protein